MPFNNLENTPEATLVLDPVSDEIRFANHKALLLLAATDNSAPLMPASHYFSACLPQLIEFTRAVDDSGEGITEDLCLFVNDEEIPLEVSAYRITGENELLLCLCLRDRERFNRWRMKNTAQKHHNFGLLEWRRIHEVFHQIEKENQLILSAAGEGIYGVDADGNTTFLNPAAERLLGFKAEELIGKNVHAVIHHSHSDGSDYCVHDCPIYAAFKDGEIRKVDDEVFWTKSNQAIAIEYTSTPIFDNGHLVGAVVVFRDISDRIEAQTKLKNALKEVEQLKQRLELENAYLQEEISAGYNSYQIVGNSPAIRAIIQQVQLVAPTDATVLVTGESGSGKELIARAIHTASDRKDRPLVRVNCAAVPSELFESEFFGHVKGAFSGALQDRLGRFQLADGGTLFLDEVGEIPLALQSKLLRALQDHEFERVGDSKTQKVNVRVIAATNQNLQKLVREGQFREDLYFRLNVFPINSVSLRDRACDIPLLASHFLKKACEKLNKPMLKISLAQSEKLQNYSWPGNIRELENMIERQVILSQGDKLILDDVRLTQNTQNDQHADSYSPPIQPQDQTLTEYECNNLKYKAIITALKECRGKVYGSNGAANLLGLKPTTLCSRLKKYGIDRRSFV